MTLDLAVARAVMRARQIERALHDNGPWAICVDGVVFPAVRWIGEDRIIFRASLPDACWLSSEAVPMDLLCRGETVGSTMVETLDGESHVEWVLAIEQASVGV